ncbi:nascent polypeptide-associated complex subunit alpha, muscle-specific form-like [Schistocerca nitens]|uniref:nascent polypeptide-associated complex subunit alpha, muscle-specific form-like n=1 Tax=Schistocerca nitens TaxID=7011 RepID=UPI002118C069|nr:nascent polypeptide-associated complex subunit alpha, muscle-specific form-like [Schistocerca nitens]
MCSREKDVPAPASDAKGVADRRPAALARSAAPSGPPLMTTTAMAMDLTDTTPETLKTALSAPLPDSEDESSTAPQPRGRSGKQKRRATAATAAARSSPIEKRAKQDFAPDADGFVPARRTARRMLSSTTPPTAVANSFDALDDAPEPTPRVPAPKKDSHLPPVVLQFRPPYGELQTLLRSWTTAVYTVKPAGRDLYRVTLRTADDYRRVTQEASERGLPFYTHASAPDKVLKIVFRDLPFNMEADHLHRELADLGFYIRTVVKMKSPKSREDMPLFLVVCSDTVENRKLYRLTYRGCEVWKRAIARQRGQTPAPHQKKPATRRPGVSFAAATSGTPSAAPAASVAPAPAASEAVPTPEAPTPPPQLPVAAPGTAFPGTSAGPRPANRRRGGHRPVGTQRLAPSVEQPQVDSHSEAATPPPSSAGAAPAASTADLANLVAQLTALVTNLQLLLSKFFCVTQFSIPDSIRLFSSSASLPASHNDSTNN